MQNPILNLSRLVVGAALFAGALSPAAAAEQHRYVRHSAMRHAHYYAGSGDVTVRKSAPRVAAAPDAFHGPAALITAPIEVAGAIVSLPFRAMDAIFPARSNDPRFVVGAPVYAAGKIAEFPFFAINSAFGVRPTLYTY